MKNVEVEGLGGDDRGRIRQHRKGVAFHVKNVGPCSDVRPIYCKNVFAKSANVKKIA